MARTLQTARKSVSRRQEASDSLEKERHGSSSLASRLLDNDTPAEASTTFSSSSSSSSAKSKDDFDSPPTTSDDSLEESDHRGTNQDNDYSPKDDHSCNNNDAALNEPRNDDTTSLQDSLDTQKEVGSRVYCRWKGNDQWYWGTVTDKRKKKTKRNYGHHYSIQFDEFDYEDDASPEEVWTSKAYRKIFHEEPPPLDLQTSESFAKKNGSKPCGACERCTRPNCGSCASCCSQQRLQLRCLQKMCCQVEVREKAQPAVGFPDGWTFCFGLPTSHSNSCPWPELAMGLALYTSEGRVFRSIRQAAMWCLENKEDNNKSVDAMVQEFCKHVGIPVPGADTSRDGSDKPTNSLQSLYKCRCKECELCRRSACKKCASCLYNQKRGNKPKQVCLQKMCCAIPEQEKRQAAPRFPHGWYFFFQTPTYRMKQVGMKQGLVLVAPNGKRYVSVQAAMSHFTTVLSAIPNLSEVFYKHVGMEVDETKAAASPKAVTVDKTKTVSPNEVLFELYTRRCKTCVLCLRPDCEKCRSCRNNRNRHECHSKEICLQKICCKIPQSDKVLQIPRFPKGWTFLIDRPQHEGAGIMDRLVLFNTVGRRYHSVETAKSHHYRALAKVSSRKFYKYIGIPQESSNAVGKENGANEESIDIGSIVYCAWPSNGYWYRAKVVSKSTRNGDDYFSVLFDDGDCLENVRRADLKSESSYWKSIRNQGKKRTHHGLDPPGRIAAGKKARGDSDEALNASQRMLDPSYSLTELYERRCKTCMLCQKEDCSKCSSCKRNENNQDVGNKEVCLRKMCLYIDINKKAQEAVGFPSGWRFVFGKPRYSTRRDGPGLEGLILLAPNGRKNHSLQGALNQNPTSLGSLKGLVQEFCAHVGAPVLGQEQVGAAAVEPVHHHLFIGKHFRQEWTDVHGRNKLVYGVVTGCIINPMDENDAVVTAEYNEPSRLHANAISSVAGSAVPRSRHLAPKFALGAIESCTERRNPHLATRRVDTIRRSLPPWSWMTPEDRLEELLDDLPRLTLVFRGFHLVFTVKESTIPGAGYGVFVKPQDLQGGMDDVSSNFALQAGEFLDLGVYAPFQSADKKKEHVLFVKNYIHSFKCEEWCFNTEDEDHLFDIADEFTGTVHELARRHIPSYVNECKKNEVATIRAEHDPEGNVHYLLGVVSGGKLVLPCGVDTELFINYGPEYESVRVRKGYSELPDQQKEEMVRELEQNDKECLERIDNEFTCEEIGDCIKFFNGMFPRDGNNQHQPADKLELSAGKRAIIVSKRLEERARRLLQDSGEQEQVPSALLDSASSLVSLLESLFGEAHVQT